MKFRFLHVAIALALLASCAAPPSATPGGNGGSIGKASIDLTVSGAIQGTTKQLAKYDCAGGQFGSYLVSLDPVIDGNQYNIGVLIGQYKSAPITIDLATPDNHATVTFGNDQRGIWSNDSHTSGSVTVDAGGDSGAVEAHYAPPASTGFAPLDVKFTFICPVPANRK